jgi:hypothetical protein
VAFQCSERSAKECILSAFPEWSENSAVYWLSMQMPDKGKLRSECAFSYHNVSPEPSISYGIVVIFIQVGQSFYVLSRNLKIEKTEHKILKCPKVSPEASYFIIPFSQIIRAEQLIKIKAGHFINKFAYF